MGTHQEGVTSKSRPQQIRHLSAEIGAGQEVARWFFPGGRRGGKIDCFGKTISAYDMTVSDAIYGHAERYVSRQRLETMLNHEFNLLLERLANKRGSTTRFFVFADTVVARSYSRQDDAHGWLGIRFQVEPEQEASQIIIHVRLWDKENVTEQEALGILEALNLVHKRFSICIADPAALVKLFGGQCTALTASEVDMAHFSGPAFHGMDNRLMALQLVQSGL